MDFPQNKCECCSIIIFSQRKRNLNPSFFFSFSVGKLIKFDLQIKSGENDQKKMITFKLITECRTLFLKINWTEHLLSVENKVAHLSDRQKMEERTGDRQCY